MHPRIILPKKSMPLNYFASCHPSINFFFLKTPKCENPYFNLLQYLKYFITSNDLKILLLLNKNNGDLIPVFTPACLLFLHYAHDPKYMFERFGK